METHEVHESLHARRFFCYCEEGSADTELAVTTPTLHCEELRSVMVAYSASVTEDVLVTFKSHDGEAFDTMLQKIPLSAARYGVWLVEGHIILHPDDAIEVVAPAGGGGITAAISVQTEAV